MSANLSLTLTASLFWFFFHQIKTSESETDYKGVRWKYSLVSRFWRQPEKSKGIIRQTQAILVPADPLSFSPWPLWFCMVEYGKNSCIVLYVSQKIHVRSHNKMMFLHCADVQLVSLVLLKASEQPAFDFVQMELGCFVWLVEDSALIWLCAQLACTSYFGFGFLVL